MKILFCSNKFDEISNGPAKFANLILKINELFPGIELRVLSEDISQPSEYLYRLDLHYPKLLRLFSQFFRIYQYHSRASEIKRNIYDFDVIIYNNAFIGLRSAKKFKNSIGMINDYNNASRNWRNFKFEYVFIKQFIFKQLERWAIYHYSKLISNSKFLNEYLPKIYPQAKGKTYLLYKAIEKPDRSKLDQPIKLESIKILFVKNDFMRGGLEDLITALGILKYRFQLTVIGPENVHLDLIKNWVLNKANVDLLFKGIVPQSVVFEELLNTNIFCVPSRKEALGVGNLEALARGVPVVSTNTGGIPEVLDYGKNGWLAEPHNPQSLSNCISECISNEKLRKQKALNGIRYCENFYLEQVLKRFLEIIKK